MAPIGPRPRQHRGSADRRRKILDAALACFTARGYDRTTIGDVCRAASASTGSVYHHFESKEQLAAALFLEGVRDAQRQFLGALVRHRSAEQGVRALVAAYLDWVEAHPDWARFLLTMRHAEFMKGGEDELIAMNREADQEARSWVEKRVARGALPRLEMVVMSAVVLGPARAFARRWVDGQTRTEMREARLLLGTAAWQALKALRAPAWRT